jgi:MFS family permease
MKGAAVFRIRSFSAFLGARFFLTFGVQVQALVLSLQVYSLDKSAFSLGLIGLAEALPFMMLILPAGYWADIYRRKTLILISSSLFLVCSSILFLLCYIEYKAGLATLYALVALTGVARATGGPSMQAIVPQLVDRQLLPQAIAWNTSFWQISSIAGPAVGGLIYAYSGLEAGYLCTFLCSTVALMLFMWVPASKVAHERKTGIGANLKEGIDFVRSKPVILSALTLDLFAVLFGGAVALLPLFNDQILHAGPEGLGWLRAAPSLGAVLTAAWVARTPPMRHTGLFLLAAVAGFGGCIMGFALSEVYLVSFTFLLLSGAFDAVSVLIRSMIVQMLTPDAMRGRVSSVNSIFIGSSNEIGAFESGVAARFLGLIPSVVFGSSMTLFITALMAWKAKSLRKLRLDSY